MYNKRKYWSVMIRLLELREEKKLSQREMAKTFFISQSTYNNWENGKTQPSIEQLIMISKFFGVSIDYLVYNEDAETTVKTDPLLKERHAIIERLQEDIDRLKEL